MALPGSSGYQAGLLVRCSAPFGVQVDAELVDGRCLPGASLHNPQMHRAGAEDPEGQPAGTGRSPWLGRPFVPVAGLLQRSGVDLGMPAVAGRRIFCQHDGQFRTDPGGAAAAGIVLLQLHACLTLCIFPWATTSLKTTGVTATRLGLGQVSTGPRAVGKAGMTGAT